MLISIIKIALAVYLGLGLILYLMQSKFTFQPTRELLYNPGDIGLEYEKVQLKTPDNVILSAWYIPAKNAEFTILFCHGNGGSMMHRLDTLNIFYEIGVNCLIFDYRGYGNSQGKPSEQGVYTDARTAYDWLINEKKISPENIILFGRSIGGSVAANLANNVKVKGVILESCFTSYADIGRKFYPYMPVKLLAKYRFNTFEYVKKLKCPILVIHSRSDEIIPFELGLRLYEQAANEP
ncbi:MAG: alpha/beta hydrolase, partial [Phycisphaerae bacterium]|nr:alpha/beta hydrolase [Phycisphaerae bacterium]